MKKVLIITNYFPPETGAASNRIYQMAMGLQKKGLKVSVVTPIPNYPKGEIFEGYKGKFKMVSEEDGIKIFRLWIYASNSKNKFLRLISMLSYSFSLISFIVINNLPRTVIIQSPPLLVAFTSLLFLRRKNRKLVLNVSDLWPLAGLELGVFKRNLAYGLLEKIERFNYKKADVILGQSEEILEYIKNIFPYKNLVLYRNYSDFEPPKFFRKEYSNGKIKLVYAGLLGVAQGIYKLCQNLDYTKIEFHIYGEGTEKSKIKSYIKSHPKLPIYFHGELSRNELHVALMEYDLAIIPLVIRIYGSVPSKIFEYAKLGLPMLYFGGGEGEELVKKHNLGWVAEPGNYKNLNKVISEIKKSDFNIDRKKEILNSAIEAFGFENQLDNLYKLL